MNLSLLMYTNETYLPIARLAVEQINKNFYNLDAKKYITSNRFSKNSSEQFKDFELINCNVPLDINGSHFAKVMKNALNIIDSEYVLFLLDDCIVINELKNNNLKNLVQCMGDNDIDYLSLLSYNFEWEPLNTDYIKYSLPENVLVKTDERFLYAFSVQPSIWKRTSLLKVLEYNPELEIHHLDITYIKNKKGIIRYHHENELWYTPNGFWDYNFKIYSLKRSHYTSNFSFDERGIEGDYFLFLYSEAIRMGKFNMNTHLNNKNYLSKFLKEKNITSNLTEYNCFF